ncbi:MAG: UDP-3-O-(3-hydroxymyristoyl)glucosamine N-acyltransferase [Sedimentisphaerales bacterium]|nr:UDP-3-O-(3-hydroxymyristoyl)glucosamine N-acyltransferase [Sedimentisphaerales bacterium]
MKLADLAQRLGARLTGDGGRQIRSVASLAEAGPEDLSFVTDDRYAAQLAESRAAAVLVPQDLCLEGPAGPAALVRVGDVNAALEQVLEWFAPAADDPAPGVHPTAVVAPSARLGRRAAVGPGAVISERVTVGDDSIIAAGCVLEADVQVGRSCRLGPNVVVRYGCRIQDRVIIHANSTIGTDGFGYRLVEGRHRKIPHIGSVLIEDDVEIGANSCVDRAKFGLTRIGRGTKIDNLVQIAHNVQVGEHCIVVAQAGVAGSATLGRYVVLGGQSGVRDHVHLGDGARIGAQCGIMQDVPSGQDMVGTPARPARVFFREVASLQKLPELAKQVKQLRRQMDQGGSAANHSQTD